MHRNIKGRYGKLRFECRQDCFEDGLERSQFYRKIKALTNYSPVELIRRIRLKHGHNLIVSTDKTISEIAYETGFSTPAYFTKCYRDAYGETPTEVRNRLGK
ncbi:helix-turn-helix domain-containing protein [Muribaculum intestinale]|uniref:helix-turn-helix domain-containing protein n=1 Tax=Muribaculum intestinale TaxID=1796646 RepID=UPI003979FCA8